MSHTPLKAHGARVEALDLLRLVAALAVVLFHYVFRGAAADNLTTTSVPEWAPFAMYGYLGVDLFFVISGFVIAWSAEGRTAVGFAIARASRIYPGFLVCMTLTFLATVLFGAPRFEATLGQWFANLFILAPFFGEAFMDGAYWSIAYEIIFYGWVTLLLAAGLFQRHLVTIVLGWLAISLLDLSILDSGLLERVFVTEYSGFFATGVMLYALRSGRRDVVALLTLTASILVALAQALSGVSWLNEHYGIDFSLPIVAGVTLANVAAVALAARVKRIILPSGLVLALGGLTYPLYLLHQHIGYIAFNRLGWLAAPEILVLGTTVVMIAASWAIWRFAERPAILLCKTMLTRAAGFAGRAAAIALPRRDSA